MQAEWTSCTNGQIAGWHQDRLLEAPKHFREEETIRNLSTSTSALFPAFLLRPGCQNYRLLPGLCFPSEMLQDGRSDWMPPTRGSRGHLVI